MIIAALYVILLVGFSRESYMRRDATVRVAAARWQTLQNISNRMCRAGQSDCEAVSAAATERQACLAPDGPSPPPTMRKLRQVLGAER
jgi:hypothetical protein